MSEIVSPGELLDGAVAPSTEVARVPRQGWLGALEDQLALRPLIREYLTPVEVNNFWYALGGVLAISLGLEVLTGVLLMFRYSPDASQAYAITKSTIETPGWNVIINFHFWNSFFIFALVMVHMMRVFISGGYRKGKQALWTVGVALAGGTFVLATTGESLHWDEVGFAVPWHVSEMLDALGWTAFWNYSHAALKTIPVATEKLTQIYGLHIGLLPLLLLLGIFVHYYLIKQKGISSPFWLRRSGRTAPFSEHIRTWMVVGGAILGVVILFAIFAPRDVGVAPQLLPSSPLYGAAHGPGGLGYKPTFPIGWTHGMNVFFANVFGIDPDIWGTMVGMALMIVALLIVPFVDRSKEEPKSWREAFDLRKRGIAFFAIGLFWLIMIVGVITNIIAGPG